MYVRLSTPPPPQHMDKSFTLTFNVILMFYLHVIKKWTQIQTNTVNLAENALLNEIVFQLRLVYMSSQRFKRNRLFV